MSYTEGIYAAGYHICREEDGQFVGEAVHQYPNGSYGEPNPDDARLWAAAPDLFEACKAALSLMPADPSWIPRRWFDTTKMLKAAIAKAEGKQS